MKQLLVVSLAAAVLASPADAHGGAFRPPPPSEGPLGKPSVPRQPKRRPPGPTAPPSTTPTPAAPVAYDPLAPPTPPGAEDLVEPTSWSWWWEFNKEPFLELKQSIDHGDPRSGDGSSFLGRDARGLVGAGLPPTRQQIRETALPTLLEALRKSRQADVLSATLIALGRLGDELEDESRIAIEQALLPHLEHGTQEVPEAALLALGLLARDGSAMLLSDVLLEREAGKQALGGGRIGLRSRSFAAYALGLLGRETEREDVRRFIVHSLGLALAADDSATPDLGSACVLAMGIVPLRPASRPLSERRSDSAPPASSREGQIETLRRVAADDDRQRVVRAQAVISLGRLLSDSDVLPEVRSSVAVELIRLSQAKSKAPREVKQSCAVALGHLGRADEDAADQRIREHLVELVTMEADVSTRHFAMLALARASTRSATAEAPGREQTRRFFLKQLARGRSHMQRFAALSLALLERGAAASGEVPAADSMAALRRKFNDARTPTDQGLYAIALGLARDVEAIDGMRRILARSSDDQARGHVAVGLGLLGAREAIPELKELMQDATYRPSLLEDTATGLALLRYRQAVPELVTRLADAKSLASQSALARALGRIGDSRSVVPLSTLVGSPRATDRARGFAAAALGMACDADRLPWTTPYALGGNYVAAPITLRDSQGQGLLNLL
jgi:HEAT repeat protein